MKLLLDTHLLLWTAGNSPRLSAEARTAIDDPENQLSFSVASLWEIAIKRDKGRDDFRVDARALRLGLIGNGYHELLITGEHGCGGDILPPIHKDPFDRLLIVQAMLEGMTLLTADPVVARYKGPVRLV